ncbi:MAG: haloacid dehalogenase type II [Acidobacteria bacterium]|nr:MAG: haloacid dehalogenase type II [Acidobacteriota bacterium]
MIQFEDFSHLTFDCYGTLIDWEAGIVAAVQPVLESRGLAVDEKEVIRLYARFEAEEESGSYRRYRSVLRGVMASLGAKLGFAPTESDLDALPRSVGSWPPFSDTVEALARLKKRYKLVILSNIDDEMFAETVKKLGTDFDEVITAEQVGSYKPALANFRFAVDRLGVPQERILHVAQSLYHDHVPAKELGFTTVWVNRPSRWPDTGVALPADASPDLEVPDMDSLAAAAGL